MLEAKQAEFLKERINACPFNRQNGIYVDEVGEGYAIIAVSLTNESMNIWNVPHGGLLFSLGDVAAGLATQSICEGRVVTISGTINFMAASKGDKWIKSRGTVIKKGKSTAFVDVEITDNAGIKIAAGQYVMHLSQR